MKNCIISELGSGILIILEEGNLNFFNITIKDIKNMGKMINIINIDDDDNGIYICRSIYINECLISSCICLNLNLPFIQSDGYINFTINNCIFTNNTFNITTTNINNRIGCFHFLSSSFYFYFIFLFIFIDLSNFSFTNNIFKNEFTNISYIYIDGSFENIYINNSFFNNVKGTRQKSLFQVHSTYDLNDKNIKINNTSFLSCFFTQGAILDLNVISAIYLENVHFFNSTSIIYINDEDYCTNNKSESFVNVCSNSSFKTIECGEEGNSALVSTCECGILRLSFEGLLFYIYYYRTF
jgi:hypothetical protein